MELPEVITEYPKLKDMIEWYKTLDEKIRIKIIPSISSRYMCTMRSEDLIKCSECVFNVKKISH